MSGPSFCVALRHGYASERSLVQGVFSWHVTPCSLSLLPTEDSSIFFPVATKWSIFIGVILVLAAGTVGAVALRVRHGEPSAEIEDSARYGYTLVGLGYVLLLVATLNIVAFGGFAQSGSLEFILPEKDGVAGRSSGVRTRKYIRQSARSKASMTEGAMATLRVSLAPYLLCSVKLLGQGAL